MNSAAPLAQWWLALTVMLGGHTMPTGRAVHPTLARAQGGVGALRGCFSCYTSAALAARRLRRGGMGVQVAIVHLGMSHGATRTDAALPPRRTSAFSPALLLPLGLGV